MASAARMTHLPTLSNRALGIPKSAEDTHAENVPRSPQDGGMIRLSPRLVNNLKTKRDTLIQIHMEVPNFLDRVIGDAYHPPKVRPTDIYTGI